MDFRQLDKYYLEHTNNGKTETAAIVNKVPYSDRRLEWSIRDALKGAVNPDAHGTYVYVTDITRDKKEIYSEVEQAVDAGRFTGKPDRAEKHWANGNPNILIIPKPDKKTMKTWWRAAGSDSLFDSYPEELTTAGIVASDEVRQEFLESYLDYGLHYNDAKERKPWKLQLDKSFPVNDHICEQIQAFVKKYPHMRITLEADSKEGAANAKLAEFLRGLEKSASYTGQAIVAGEKISSPFAQDLQMLKENKGLKTEEQRKAEYIDQLSDSDKRDLKLGLVELPSFKKANSFQAPNTNERESGGWRRTCCNTWDISTYGELSDEQLKAMEAFHKEHPEITIWGTEDQQKQFPGVEDKEAATKRIQLVASGKANVLDLTDLTRIPSEVTEDFAKVADQLKKTRKGKAFDLVLSPDQERSLHCPSATPIADEQKRRDANWKRTYRRGVEAGLKGKGKIPTLKRTLTRLLSSNSRKGKGSR